MIDNLDIRVASADNPRDAADLALLLSELNATVGSVGVPEEVSREPRYVYLTPEQAAQRMRRAQSVERVLIASYDGQPAGFTALRVIPYLDQDTPYAEVTQMHTRPDFRRRGIGAALIAAAERLSREAGATCVHILTGDDNLDAQAFYSAQGYHVDCYAFVRYFDTTEARQAAHA
jgi:ribosomal protein S18 acetylase RimI-like enzyme